MAVLTRKSYLEKVRDGDSPVVNNLSARSKKDAQLPRMSLGAGSQASMAGGKAAVQAQKDSEPALIRPISPNVDKGTMRQHIKHSRRLPDHDLE